jgi:hypothetical protein
MANKIRRVDYFYTLVPNRPGQAARVLAGLRDAGDQPPGFCWFRRREGHVNFKEKAVSCASGKG